MQETASPTTEPLPVPTEETQEIEKSIPEPTDEQPAPVEEEGTQAEPEAEGEPEAERSPFDPALYAEDEVYKEHVEDVKREAHRQGQLREAGRHKEIRALAGDVAQGVMSLNQVLKEAVQNGANESQIASIVKENAPILNGAAKVFTDEVMPGLRRQNAASALADALYTIANHPSVNNPDLAKDFFPRLLNLSAPIGQDPNGNPIYAASEEFGLDGGPGEIVADFTKAFAKYLDKKGFERRTKSDTDASTEAAKAASREGKGPGEVRGTGGSHGYTKQQLLSMSPEEYGKVPPEVRAKVFAADA